MDNGVALKRECSIVNAVSMESLDNCSTISSGDNQTQVRTLFVSGLPLDIKARELYLLFRSCNGYESSQLKSSTSGKNSSNSLIKPTNFPPVGFVTFATRHDAEEALNNLQGIRFDPELAQTLRLEFARSNTKVTRPKHAASSSPTANTTPNTTFLSPAAILAPSIPSINGITQEKFSFQRMQEGGSNSLVGNLLSPQLTKTGQYDTIATLSSQLSSTNQYALPLSGVELANSQLIGMQNLQKSQTHCQQIQALRQILAVSAANQQQNVIAALAHAQQQALSATILVSNNQINNSPTTATGTALTPPCSTLFIANLGSYPNLEDELRAMFRPLPGFSRIRIHAKGGNATSVAFAEFQTVEQARVAMQRLQGRVLGNNQGSTGSRGIRIEFAKTKMADSTSSPQYNYINGLCPNGIASAV